jgi:glycosyltransferase involved in cell wall biosynthesis
MKILHVITTINLGGAENHLASMVIEQIKGGDTVFVVYLKGDHYWKKKLEENGAKVVCLNLTSYLGTFVASAKLGKIINSFRPDIVHAHMPPAELVTSICIKLFSKNKFNYLCTKHNDERFAPIWGQKILGQWCFKNTSKVIVISDAVKVFIESQFRIKSSQDIHRIYYGISLSDYENISDELVKNQKDKWSNNFTIGVVARLVPQKSLDTLIKALKILIDNNRDIHLVIIGEGELFEDLKRLTVELNVEKNVQFMGKRSDIPFLMSCFDLFVLPSIYEGLGLVLLEAMAAGKPIVASNVSAIPEIVRDGIDGILFKPKDYTSLAKIIKKFLDKEIKYDSVMTIQRVRNEFSIETMYLNTKNVYDEMINL